MPLRANAWPSAPTTGSSWRAAGSGFKPWWIGSELMFGDAKEEKASDVPPNADAFPETAPARNADPTPPAGVPGAVSRALTCDGSGLTVPEDEPARLATTVAATSASTADVAAARSRSSAPSVSLTTSRAMSSTRGPASRRISADVDASSSFCSAAAFSARSTTRFDSAPASPDEPRAAASTDPGSCAALAGRTYRRNESSAA
mmetsp:Transcript_9481/g.38436  ORF Transcript_9481/g.38436 Transcript_9481/m.38436 type:complete len:203 (+) Transcript_9481:1844-2452(+)